MTPALAVIDELRDQGGWKILFIGRKHASETDKALSVESEIIPKMGIKFVPITTGRVYREISLLALLSLTKIPLGFGQSLYNLLKFRPQVILSFGGYLSVPVVLAGWLLGIPIVSHEQTTVKGLATRFNEVFSKKVAVSWPNTIGSFSSKKVVLSGNPIRQAVFKNHQQFWESLGFAQSLPLIVVTGGNQGSHVINQIIGKILPKILIKANVFHQCGHLISFDDFQNLKTIKKQLPVDLRSHYQVDQYISQEALGTLFDKADLIISRAGINTLTELLLLGKPAVLIPYPYQYQSEQIKNAQMVADLGMAEILMEKELTPNRLYNLIIRMLGNIKVYQKKASQGKKMVRLDAAKKIVEILREVLVRY